MTQQKKYEMKSAHSCIPTDAVSLKILHERASMLAKVNTENKKNDREVNYIKIRLSSNEYYGVPYEFMREVVQNTTMTPLLSKSNYLIGAINIRSGLIGVIDIRKLLNITTNNSEEQNYIIIVSDGEFIFGIIANELMGSGVYDADKIQTGVYEGLVNMNLVIGLDEDKTTIIDIKNICKNLQSLRG